MFDQITEKFHALSKRLRGQAHLSDNNLEEILREIRLVLLAADVALPVVRDFLAQVKNQAIGQEVLKSLTPGQMFIGIVHQQLQKMLGIDEKAWELRAAAPAVILMAGLQGVGKTTQSAKIGRWLKHQKKKVLLVSADAYRPAAVEQLRTLAAQIEVDFFAPPADKLLANGRFDPIAIAESALTFAQQHLYEVLIVDTAGRLSVDESMMKELSDLEKRLNPAETFLTIDAMQGQNALATASAFAGRVRLTGLVITKTDGDARGGAVLSARMITGVPIRFAGISEKMEGLERFDARRMADRIVGMGDMVGLFEQAVANVDQTVVDKFAQKLKKGKGFDLSDFRAQIVQMRKMGGMESLLEKMPMEVQKIANKVPHSFADREIAHMQGIIDAMTPRERINPELIKASRKKRIAQGSGTTVQEVNKLLNQFAQMEKMSKKLKGMGGLLAKMGGLGGGLGGMGGLGTMSDLGKYSSLLKSLKK